MKPTKHVELISALALFLIAALGISFPVAGQKKSQTANAGPLSLTRKTSRHDTYRLGFGGSVTIVGPPSGSITVEGWQRNEVEVTAEIELHANSEADLDRLATVDNFLVNDDINHVSILTTGTHDRDFMKRAAKNFPKVLIGLPWKIDYHIKLPAVTDVEINAGNGPLSLSGVEGAIRINALESNANLEVTGGLVSATFQKGTVNVSIPTRGWHGLGAEVRLASGTLNIDLAPGFNANLNAEVLRTGEIKNSYPNLEPVTRDSMTQHSLQARAGSGGATLTFTAGDGTIEIRQAGKQ